MANTTGREAAIRGLQDYRQELLDSMSKLQEDLRTVEQTMNLLTGSSGSSAPLPATKRIAADDVGPQEAVENFLRSSPGKSYRPRDLAKELQGQGYQPNTTKPEIWYAQVTNCLRRATAKGIASMIETEDGKKTYGLRAEDGKSGACP